MKKFLQTLIISTSVTVGIVSPSTNAQNLSFTASQSAIYPITGNLPDLKFSLKTRGNQIITEKDVRGKIVIMYFGYAHCPDVCPMTMAELSNVLRHLGPEKSKQIQILFVSVDPLRDTPDLLQHYVDAFKNGAIGLSGTPNQIADIARRYRVSYQVDSPKNTDSNTNYEVMHGRGIYIFDAKGKAKYLASDAQKPELLVAKLNEMLKNKE